MVGDNTLIRVISLYLANVRSLFSVLKAACFKIAKAFYAMPDARDTLFRTPSAETHGEIKIDREMPHQGKLHNIEEKIKSDPGCELTGLLVGRWRV